MVVCIKDALVADMNNVDLSNASRKEILYGNNDQMNYYRKAQYYELIGNMHAILVSEDITDEIKETNLYKYVQKNGGTKNTLEELFGKNYDDEYIEEDILHYVRGLMKEYGRVNVSFNDVILRMIDYHTNQNKGEYSDYNSIKNKVIKDILETYFYLGSASKFSLKNNTYQYVTEFKDGKLRVTKNRQNEILSEMKEYLRRNNYSVDYDDVDRVIDMYSGVIASKYISSKRNTVINKNNLYKNKTYEDADALTTKDEIISYIFSLNVNDSKKTSLVNDFNNGNYAELRMFGNEINELLNNYDRNHKVTEKDIILAIDDLNLNDKLRNYLKSCFYDGNYDEIKMRGFDNINHLLRKYENQVKKERPIK